MPAEDGCPHRPPALPVAVQVPAPARSVLPRGVVAARESPPREGGGAGGPGGDAPPAAIRWGCARGRDGPGRAGGSRAPRRLPPDPDGAAPAETHAPVRGSPALRVGPLPVDGSPPDPPSPAPPDPLEGRWQVRASGRDPAARWAQAWGPSPRATGPAVGPAQPDHATELAIARRSLGFQPGESGLPGAPGPPVPGHDGAPASRSRSSVLASATPGPAR